MLVRFAASNIGSIDGRQELSLVPSAFYKDREEVLVPCGAVPTRYLLPSAIIYGANASGKSNVVNSIQFLQRAVINSQIRGKPDGGFPKPGMAMPDAACANSATSSTERASTPI